MTIVSIDFSILYPGACICRNFTDFKWIAGVNTDVRKIDQDHFSHISKNYLKLKIVHTESRRKKADQYHLTERTKLTNYLELIDVFVGAIADDIKYDPSPIFCLEGISFGSSGNSLVDISQATGMLKMQICSKLLHNRTDGFFIFSPSELKNAIGCKGNANKEEILEKFKSDPVIAAARESDLYRLVCTEPWIKEKGKILSPVIDMVDSYLGVVKIHELLK